MCWWRGRHDCSGQGTTVALGPTSAARPIGPSTAYPSKPAGRWGHAGALPASVSSRLLAHATHLTNAEVGVSGAAVAALVSSNAWLGRMIMPFATREGRPLADPTVRAPREPA